MTSDRRACGLVAEAPIDRQPVNWSSNTMSPTIRIEDLVKDFGSFRALNGVDLEVRAGEVLGFIGPNGAGKSTTIGVLLDLLRPTSGHVEVFGANPARSGAEIRTRIGISPANSPWTGRETHMACFIVSPASEASRDRPDRPTCRTVRARSSSPDTRPVQGQQAESRCRSGVHA